MAPNTFSGVDTQSAGGFPWDPSSKVNANAVIGINTAGNFLNMVGDGIKNILNYQLMNKMFGLQNEQMGKYYDLQGKLVGLNETLVGSQERIAVKQLSTTRDIAELQKDRDVAVAKTRADAAVKIAKVNALNSQFYGQPNQLPSWNS